MAKYKLHPQVKGFLDPTSRTLFTPGVIYDIPNKSPGIAAGIRQGRLILQPEEEATPTREIPSEAELQEMKVKDLKELGTSLFSGEELDEFLALTKKSDLIDFILSL
jgi:hypothetical protein